MKHIIITALLLGTLTGNMLAAPFQNGSFEFHSLDQQIAPGWVKTGNVGFGPGGGATDGAAGAGWNGDNSAPNAVLGQTFDTVAGLTYLVRFDFGQLQDSLTQQLLVEVKDFNSGVQLIVPGSGTVDSVSGGFIVSNTSQLQVADTTGAPSTVGPVPNFEFSTFSFSFVAASSSSVLFFTDQANGTINSDGELDNVIVSVPEPTSAALLISGFLLLMTTNAPRVKRIEI